MNQDSNLHADKNLLLNESDVDSLDLDDIDERT